MNCNKCDKKLTQADIPNYITQEELEKLKNLYFRCKLCRDDLEKRKKDIEVTELMQHIALELMRKENKVMFFIKFTCHNCNARQGDPDNPNKFFQYGYTCEECDKITVPDKIGYAKVVKV